jgi:hypothetical protein
MALEVKEGIITTEERVRGSNRRLIDISDINSLN